MSWVWLLVAGVFEIGWTVGLKYSHGFSRLWPSVATVIAMVLSVVFLAMAVKHLPLGTAYAVWTGIGAVGAVICGILLFGDSAAWPRLACLGIIIVGIVGLKLVTGGE